MRHGKKVNHLGRTSSHRKALMSNLANALLLSPKKRIITTMAKAKALRVYVEPLITKSKDDNMHSRRTVFAYLQNKESVKELFGSVSEKVADRPGGYTRILKLGPRVGDNAEMALIELVDFSEFNVDKSKKRSRRRGGSKKAAEKKAAEQPQTETTENTDQPPVE